MYFLATGEESNIDAILPEKVLVGKKLCLFIGQNTMLLCVCAYMYIYRRVCIHIHYVYIIYMIYSICYLYHISFIHFSDNGELDGFHPGYCEEQYFEALISCFSIVVLVLYGSDWYRIFLSKEIGLSTLLL